MTELFDLCSFVSDRNHFNKDHLSTDWWYILHLYLNILTISSESVWRNFVLSYSCSYWKHKGQHSINHLKQKYRRTQWHSLTSKETLMAKDSWSSWSCRELKYYWTVLHYCHLHSTTYLANTSQYQLKETESKVTCILNI